MTHWQLWMFRSELFVFLVCNEIDTPPPPPHPPIQKIPFCVWQRTVWMTLLAKVNFRNFCVSTVCVVWQNTTLHRKTMSGCDLKRHKNIYTSANLTNLWSMQTSALREAEKVFFPFWRFKWRPTIGDKYLWDRVITRCKVEKEIVEHCTASEVKVLLSAILRMCAYRHVRLKKAFINSIICDLTSVVSFCNFCFEYFQSTSFSTLLFLRARPGNAQIYPSLAIPTVTHELMYVNCHAEHVCSQTSRTCHINIPVAVLSFKGNLRTFKFMY